MNTYEINLNNELLLDLICGQDNAYRIDNTEALMAEEEYLNEFLGE